MTSKDSSKMTYYITGTLFSILEYVRFLRRWQVSTIFFSQKVGMNASETCANCVLWVCEKEYNRCKDNVQFVNEEKQLHKLLSEIKTLLISIDISDRTNEELVKENNALLGLDN